MPAAKSNRATTAQPAPAIRPFGDRSNLGKQLGIIFLEQTESGHRNLPGRVHPMAESGAGRLHPAREAGWIIQVALPLQRHDSNRRSLESCGSR